MNSTTYDQIQGTELEALLRREGGTIGIDEAIPNGMVRKGGKLYAVDELKRIEEAAYYRAQGLGKDRSGYTKPGQQPRNKAKAKAARAARKRNR